MSNVKALFLDIGGVLLSDGWDRFSRKKAIDHFNLEPIEFGERHQMNFSTLEDGKLSLEMYLDRVVFYEERPFTREEFQKFMFSHSSSYPEMIELMTKIKAKYGLKIIVVSNEGRELNEFRIQKFKLDQLVDFFVSSCFVGIRKPDLDIYRLALDMGHLEPKEVIYVENTQSFVEVGESIGLPTIHHTDYASTREKLAEFGLAV